MTNEPGIPVSENTGNVPVGRNVAWNLLGLGLPMLVAVCAIPPLVHGLGAKRFGLLTLAWVVIGYFSLFDLGMGRALTRVVAERRGSGRDEEIPSMVRAALPLMLALGLVGSLTLRAISPWLLLDILRVPPDLRHESIRSFSMLALAIPVVIMSAALRGVLEGHQKFGLANLVRGTMGSFSFLGPLLVLPFTHDLAAVVTTLVAGQTLALLAYVSACSRVIPGLFRRGSMSPAAVRPLIRFGGWVTVSNITGPIMVYIDRFLIGSLLSLSAVTFYATPYEFITRAGVLPAALAGALFPVFSTDAAAESDRVPRLMARALAYVFLGLFPITLIAVLFARDGLSWWLGAPFALASTGVLQWLAAGVLVNGLAQIPYALIQGFSRPDITAKLHLIELPFYLLITWQLIVHRGIKGAAMAWTLRAVVDAVLLLAVAAKLAPRAATTIRTFGFTIGAGLSALAIGAQLPDNPRIKFLFAIAGVLMALLPWLVQNIKRSYAARLTFDNAPPHRHPTKHDSIRPGP